MVVGRHQQHPRTLSALALKSKRSTLTPDTSQKNTRDRSLFSKILIIIVLTLTDLVPCSPFRPQSLLYLLFYPHSVSPSPLISWTFLTRTVATSLASLFTLGGSSDSHSCLSLCGQLAVRFVGRLVREITIYLRPISGPRLPA